MRMIVKRATGAQNLTLKKCNRQIDISIIKENWQRRTFEINLENRNRLYNPTQGPKENGKRNNSDEVAGHNLPT